MAAKAYKGLGDAIREKIAEEGQFFNWLVDEEEIETHPMGRMSAPVAPEVPIPVVDDEALRRLLRGV